MGLALKLSLTLQQADVAELVREGLERRGLLVTGDSDVAIRLKPDENGTSFVVQVDDVRVSAPLAPPPVKAPAVADVRELPDELAPAPAPKRIVRTKVATPDPEPEDADDGSSFRSLLSESTQLARESRAAGANAAPNPRVDAAMLGGRAFRSFDEIGKDPAVVDRDELYPGPNPNAAR